MDSELAVTLRLESNIESIDPAEDKTRRFARDIGFNESDQYFIGLATREVLVNAIKHGNRFDSGKHVVLRLLRDHNALIIEVTDEGAGFLLDAVPSPGAPENLNRRSGRGIAIALSIMDEVTSRKASSGGACVRMVKHLNGS